MSTEIPWKHKEKAAEQFKIREWSTGNAIPEGKTQFLLASAKGLVFT